MSLQDHLDIRNIIHQHIGHYDLPPWLLNGVSTPNVETVFETLFTLMYNKLPRNVVNEFYCTFIVQNKDFVSGSINNLFEHHCTGAYYDFVSKRYIYRTLTDSEFLINAYCPFHCADDDGVAGDSCASRRKPSFEILRYKPFQSSVYDSRDDANPPIQFVIHLNSHGPETLSPDFYLENCTLVSQIKISDTEYKLNVEVIDGDEPVSVTVNASNCRGPNHKKFEWVPLNDENEDYGAYNWCVGDFPYNSNIVMNPGSFDSNGTPVVNYEDIQAYIIKCGGSPIKIYDNVGTPGQPHKLFEMFVYNSLTNNYNYRLDTANVVCTDIDRYQLITATRISESQSYSSTWFMDLIMGKPRIFFAPKKNNVPYLNNNTFDDVITVKPLSLPSHVDMTYAEFDAATSPIDYFYWTKKHTPNIQMQTTTQDVEFSHFTFFNIVIDPVVPTQDWPMWVFIKPDDRICPSTYMTIVNQLYPGTDEFSYAYRISLFSIDPNYNMSGITQDHISFLIEDDVVEFIGSSFVADGYPQHFDLDYFGFYISLPSRLGETGYLRNGDNYLAVCTFRCIIFYLVINIKRQDPPSIILDDRPPNQLLSSPTYQPPPTLVYVGEDDVSNQCCCCQIMSDIDGLIQQIEGLTDLVYSLLSTGTHNITYNLTFTNGTTASGNEQVTYEPCLFKITSPEQVSMPLEEFKDMYMNSPCKLEGDQYRIDSGKEIFKWNDNLAYAALRHALYLDSNGGISHYEVDGNAGFTGVGVGDRVTFSGYLWKSVGEGTASGVNNFCDLFNMYKAEYTDDMDPTKAGHFGAWVKPLDPAFPDRYIRDLGFAIVGDKAVIVYGEPRSPDHGIIPPLPEGYQDSLIPADSSSALVTNLSYDFSTLLTCPSYGIPDVVPTSISWESDILGPLGVSPRLHSGDDNVQLTPGTHLITAMTSFNGGTFTDSTTVTIEEQTPCTLTWPVYGSSIEDQKYLYENCTQSLNDYRILNNYPALEENDYLMQEALLHAYYLYINNIDMNPDINFQSFENLGFVAVQPKQRVLDIGYKFTSFHYAVVEATNMCDAWYKIESDLTEGNPPAHHYLSNNYIHYGYASYGRFTVIVMCGLNVIHKPLVKQTVPAQNTSIDYSTYVYQFNDPITGNALTLLWESNIDGPLGEFESISRSNVPLSYGEHQITASGEASCGPVSITFPVVIEPSFHIEVLSSYDSYNISLLDDSSNLPYTGSVIWTSNIDGIIPVTGSILNDSTDPFKLESGNHVLTAVISVNNKEITVTNTIDLEMDILRYVDLSVTNTTGLVLTAVPTKVQHDLTTGEWYIDCLPTIFKSGAVTTSEPFIYPGNRVFTFVLTVNSRTFKKQLSYFTYQGIMGFGIPYKFIKSFSDMYLKTHENQDFFRDVVSQSDGSSYQIDRIPSDGARTIGSSSYGNQIIYASILDVSTGLYLNFSDQSLTIEPVSNIIGQTQGSGVIVHTFHQILYTRYRSYADEKATTTTGGAHDYWKLVTALPFYDHNP